MRDLEIHDDVHPEICEPLRELALDRAARFPSGGSNNIGGWKSDEGFLDLPVQCVRVLLVHLMTRLGHRPLGWAMVNRNGSVHKRHRHGLQYQCGVYYVTPGDPAMPTIFETATHVMAASAVLSPTQRRPITILPVEVVPVPGRLVLFPGSMWHSVPRYDGTAPRISIAFEVRP